MTEQTGSTLDAARALHQAGKLDAAEDAYRSYIADHEDDAEAHHLLGLVLHGKGEPEAAESVIAKAVALDPRAASFRFNHGILLEAVGRYQDAVTAYRFAHALQPDNTMALNTLATMYAKIGEVQLAEKTLREALEIKPNAPELVLNLAELVLEPGQLERLDEARDLLAPLLETMPQFMAAQALMARALSRSDQKAAEKLIRSVVKRDPKNLRFRKTLTQLLYRWDRFADTALAAQDVLDKSPFEVDTLTLLAAAKLRTGEEQYAVDLLSRADRLDPDGLSKTSARRNALWAAGLHRVGRSDDGTFLTALDRTVSYEALSPPLGFGKLGSFNEQISTEILKQPRHAPASALGTGPAIQTGDLLTTPTPVLTAIARSISDRVVAYRDALMLDADHPFLRSKPHSFRISVWGIVLEGEARVPPHIQDDAWVSGIYCVSMPQPDGTGSRSKIELGRLPQALKPSAEIPIQVLEPVAGHIAVFPSSTFQGITAPRSQNAWIGVGFNAYLV